MYHFQRDTKNQYQSTILHRCNLEFAVDQRSLLASNRLAAPCILAKETAKFFFFFFSSNHRHEIFRRSTKRQQRYRFNRVFTSPSPLLFFLLPSSFFLSFFFSSLSPLPFPPPFYRLSLPHRRIPRSLARASACSTRSCTVSRGLVLTLMSDDKGFQR